MSGIAHRAKASWHYPERWLAAWHEQLTLRPEHLLRWRVRVAENAGTVAGFAAVDVDAHPAGLEHCWVDPPAMGQGVGRALVLDGAGLAAQAGHHTLEVESDPHAVGFYRRLGGHVVGSVHAPVLGRPRQLPLVRFTLPMASPGRQA